MSTKNAQKWVKPKKAEEWSGASPKRAEMVWEKPKKGSGMVWEKAQKDPKKSSKNGLGTRNGRGEASQEMV